MELYDTEEQQVEAIKEWWKENGKAVIVGAVVGLGGIFGWRFYQDSQADAQNAASLAYDGVLKQIQTSGAESSSDALAFIEANKDSQYSVLAALQLAKAFVEAGELDKALEQLSWAKTNTKDESIVSLLTVREARVLAEQEKFDDALTKLDSVKEAGWAGRIAELRGDILLRQGNTESAYAAYSEAQQQSDTSQALQMKLDDLAK
ncbi:putative TPR repeat protein [Vibrio nigripulchritudo SFn27]|uniref:Ancillary SecYEG translocon subunit n=1 Tax=Vibrio nigripulchritudo TaxID=28173 RepID=U4K841_9VIBR|nr:YfgM family protein [Vibrio nigripulchritudo]CCN82267.1 putative TPR repeat protein [Vibrio nigripulchritudo BLFn1]CCN88517.1 putative TPR repeat protein [Vibrio nigripulchritudo SFn27]CCN95924.1 putative TPR repeat protein [Vibrio nigripulchritudo ENn2]CCO39187.1 putative TPR repeat protein [Vibrio nigripulchritudo SFn135]CCO50847.1 putative TPR repeat protein [Vibrio nigripulchritudo Wn13]